MARQKNIITILSWVIIIFITLMILSCCNNQPSVTSHGKVLQGNHELFLYKEDSLNQEKEFWRTNNELTEFFWQGNDKTIMHSCLATSKVRYQIDELNEKPSVKFRWSSRFLNHSIDSTIVYAVIICQPQLIKHLDLK